MVTDRSIIGGRAQVPIEVQVPTTRGRTETEIAIMAPPQVSRGNRRFTRSTIFTRRDMTPMARRYRCLDMTIDGRLPAGVAIIHLSNSPPHPSSNSPGATTVANAIEAPMDPIATRTPITVALPNNRTKTKTKT